MEFVKLDDVSEVTKLAGYEFTKYVQYIPNGEIIAIRALNLKDGRLDLSDVQKVSHEVSQSLSRSKLYVNDIVVSYTGTIGACAIIKQDNKFHLAPNVCKITPSNAINADYLYYVIRSDWFQKQMRGYCHGSTQPTIPMKTIRELKVPILEIDTQHRIASILSSLDSKIETNNKINAKLEEMAQALFKSWFVDFEPFKDGKFVESELGMIPEGWRVYGFRDLLSASTERTGNESIPEFSVTNTGIHPREGKFNKSLSKSSAKNKILRKGNLVFGMSREILNWGVMKEEVGGVSSAYNIYIIDEKVVPAAYLELFISHNIGYFHDLIKPATREGQGLDKAALFSKYIYVPTQSIYDDFLKKYLPIVSQTSVLTQENLRLSQLRDTLLPKLMNGEIEI